ncbi:MULTISPECIES: SAR2788 family putative toxin [unclassified Lysinibacillus]|uniref:SAR2788 family putative toxin n=1 Tax=unclassified Lysinibacillus TaxID=2636778 RepID=UPI00380FE4D5
MKKIIYAIIFTLFASNVLPHVSYAYMPTFENNNVQQHEGIEINSEENDENLIVDISLATDDVKASAQLTFEYQNNMHGSVKYLEEMLHDDVMEKDYELQVLEFTEENYHVNLTDMLTGERTELNSLHAEATALPAVAILIIRVGLQYAIKHYGKKAAIKALIDLGVSQITEQFGGTVKTAKNNKGKVITIPNKKQEIVVRLMEDESGVRSDPYWRMSVGSKSIDINGNFESKKEKTHIKLDESSPATIIKLIKKFKK